MLHPVLTLLVAGSLQWQAEAPQPVDLAAIVVQIMQTAKLPAVPSQEAEAAPTVCDVRYYYDVLAPARVPAVPILVTYDWRSPIIFDLP